MGEKYETKSLDISFMKENLLEPQELLHVIYREHLSSGGQILKLKTAIKWAAGVECICNFRKIGLFSLKN